MNWGKVELILKDCEKGPGISEGFPASLPADFIEFLGRFNGAEGFVAPDQYLALWRGEKVEELNSAYEVRRFLPGVLLFGTDGADTGYGVDSSGRYISIPLIGMAADQLADIGGSFEELLEGLSKPL